MVSTTAPGRRCCGRRGNDGSVGLTEPAKIATIPIEEDGSAGEVAIFADLTKAGPDDGPAAVDGIDVDDDGNVYVAAPLIHSVLRVSSDGRDLSTVADADDDLDGPASVAIGADASRSSQRSPSGKWT